MAAGCCGVQIGRIAPGARPLTIRLGLLDRPLPGAASGRQGRSREAGARQRQPLRPEAGQVHCCQQQRPQASSGRIQLALRTPSDWIGNPAVDVGLVPAAPVDADLNLRRERALGDLAVDGGPGQAGPSKDGFQTDDPVWFAHGRAASCWLPLTASEPRQDKQLQADKRDVRLVAAWRRDGGGWAP
jgi:hypothetical protein